jgi:hypothetical protein
MSDVAPEEERPGEISMTVSLAGLQGHLTVELQRLLDMLRVSMAGLETVDEPAAAKAIPFFSVATAFLSVSWPTVGLEPFMSVAAV